MNCIEKDLRNNRLLRQRKRNDILLCKKNSRDKINSSVNDREQNPFMRTIREYTSASVIHGVSYMNPDGRMIAEKIIWTILVASAFAFAAYEVHSLYENWQESPVLTVLDTVTLPIEEIDFPAITICPQGSSKDIMNAALFEQFKNFVLNKTDKLTHLQKLKSKRKREVDEDKLDSLISDSDMKDLIHEFLLTSYGTNKTNPMELVQLLTSNDPDNMVENKAIWISDETDNCNDSSYSTIIDRLNQELNPTCPNGSHALDEKICIYVGEVVESYPEAEFYCEIQTRGLGALLSLDSPEQLTELKNIILKGTSKFMFRNSILFISIICSLVNIK